MPSFCWGHLSPTPNCVLCGHGDVIHKRLSPAPKSGWAIRVPLPSEHRHEGQSAFFRQLSDQVEEKFFIGWFTQGSVGLELLEFSLTLTPLLERAWPGHKRRNPERGAVSQSVQSLSRVQLCDPMDCSTPGFPVLHYLLEFVQTHAH